MIAANELRIGNLVKLETGKIVPINISGISAINAGYLRVYQTPLTPEILEKCGFNYKELNHNKIWIKSLNVFGFSINLYVHDEKIFFSPFELNWEIEIKYLHQLQNLYFALTGTELEFKP